MNENIDLAFIVAKLAAIKDEKARIIVGAASLTYNMSQIIRLKAMAAELTQLCSSITLMTSFRGYYTEAEYNTAVECKKQLLECNSMLEKHGAMSILDYVSLLIDGLGTLDRK